MAHDASQLKIRTARLSVASNLLLVALKLVVGLVTQSIGVIAEAVHSAVDLAAAVMAWLSVKKSAQPADHDHHYGHGKFESIAGAAEALLIFAVALGIAWAAGRHLVLGQHEVRMPLAGAAVMVLGGLVNLAVSQRLFRVARDTDSIALEADALHLRTDVYTMGGVLLAMLVIAVGRALGVSEIDMADPIAALVVAGVIIWAAWNISRRALGHLADASLPPDEEGRIEALIRSHYPQFVGFHRLRSRVAGSERHVDLHLVVPPTMSVTQAHGLCDHLEQDIEALMPNTEIMIHVEPAPRSGSRRGRRRPT